MPTQNNTITKADLNPILQKLDNLEQNLDNLEQNNRNISKGQAFVYWGVGILALAIVAFVVLIITLLFLGYGELNNITGKVGENTAHIQTQK